MKKISIQTGSVQSVMQQIASIFGGNPSEDRKLQIQNSLLDVDYELFFPFEGIEIGLHNVHYKSDFEVDVTSDENDKKFIYFQFEYSGNTAPKRPEISASSKKVTWMSMQSTGMVLNLKATKGDRSQWVTVRVSQDHFEKYMSHMKVHIGKVFDTENPWVIYEMIPPKINLFLTDLFHLDKNLTPPLRNSIVLSRTVEAVGNFLDLIIKRESDQMKNNSLHIEDIQRIQQIKNELITLYNNTPSLNSFAEKYGVSVSKLKRDFNSVFGTTIPRFHANYKLELAYKMLQTNQISITEVARKLGYKSLSNFSENFKEKFDTTPKEVSKKYN